MTTITCDGRTVAADSLTFVGTGQAAFIDKLERFSDDRGEVILTGVHSLAMFQALKRWYKDGAKIEDWCFDDSDEDFCAELIIFQPNGIIRIYNNAHPCGLPVEFNKFPVAFGSGSNIALKVMMDGGSPVEAVKEAIKYDPCSGGEIQVMPWVWTE